MAFHPTPEQWAALVARRRPRRRTDLRYALPLPLMLRGCRELGGVERNAVVGALRGAGLPPLPRGTQLAQDEAGYVLAVDAAGRGHVVAMKDRA